MSELKVVRPVSRDEMTEDEFDEKMARGVARAQTGEGVPADEYFFLKLIDSSRNTYVRNPKSHKIND